jgi:hypothetical protein
MMSQSSKHLSEQTQCKLQMLKKKFWESPKRLFMIIQRFASLFCYFVIFIFCPLKDSLITTIWSNVPNWRRKAERNIFFFCCCCSFLYSKEERQQCSFAYWMCLYNFSLLFHVRFKILIKIYFYFLNFYFFIFFVLCGGRNEKKSQHESLLLYTQHTTKKMYIFIK